MDATLIPTTVPTPAPLPQHVNLHQLLRAYLHAPEIDLVELAACANLPLPDLLTWLHHPDTKAFLESLAAANETRLRYAAAAAAPAALAALTRVLEAPLPDNPSATHLETRRRAAGQILRHTEAQARSPGVRPQTRQSRPAEPPTPAAPETPTPAASPTPTITARSITPTSTLIPAAA